MTKNEAETELVLGNKQLLSAFFIVVILFGVFFTMGYMMGRSSSPTSGVRHETATDSGPGTTQHRPGAASGKVPETRGAAPSETRAESRDASQPATQPAGPEEAKTVEPGATPAPAQATEPAPVQTYLQIAAVKQPEAELLVDALKNKGFPAAISPSPNPSLFRVLVGPLPDAATIGKIRADLESAGFKSAFLVRK